MLSFPTPSVYQASKCFVTYGVMGHLDPNQPPTKSKPWSTVAGQDFINRAELIIPQEAFDVVQKILNEKAAPEFKRVVMSLHDIFSGDFYAEYIKKGDIMMLSEGRKGVDNVFTLRNGILTLFLDKEAYERAGLVGKPDGVKGKRGLKPRWVVEVDLTGPSMVPGKKGFDRLIYASKNALGTPVTWLFCNLSSTVPDPDPFPPHYPTNCTAEPSVLQNIDAVLPTLTPPVDAMGPEGRDELEYFSTDLYEWLSLVRLQSPRVLVGDQIDPYLCRYQVPGDGQQSKICKVTWQGFLAPSWCRQTLLNLVAGLPSKTWFSFSTTTFSKGMAGDNSEVALFRPQGASGEYVMWEIKSHE
ncbi:ribonuclease P 40kDa subunit-domain-containing protein [Pseudoneurospora amorphoporcata]|uniref:Ribonuclease P 40kDa subunit-domain-containing protein n=1 Tax=Pseudoneurospora amorphoporcata TaxID=241081 RepID=A0AAN6P0R5_9PEZI|nr:ribonuclease P 40kDa subunit-domain-containing protein [Pseudoneurospora amorphoporcata]